MDRRRFIKTGAAAVAAGSIAGPSLLAAASAGDKPAHLTTKNAFPSVFSSESGKAGRQDLLVRFLGTGAADWNGPDERGEHRRLSSVLLDGRILLDFTATDAEMLPEGFRKPDAVFYTHSHYDHYDPEAELRYAGSKVVYVGETWLARAQQDFRDAAARLGKTAPEVRGLAVGESVVCGDITVTALPGNHATGDDNELTLIYLVEKGAVRVLYATDTGGIPARAARLAGIDAHIPDGKPVSGLIMEATMGLDFDEDFRIYTHSSVGTVLRTSNVLLSTGRLKAPQGQPVYITHLARTLHGTQAELDARLPSPLRAAYDGLEVIFRP
ncbi:MAG: MBL fold metallo-hydrolase [Candidatus Cryptobacteroides sp.]